MLLFIYWDSLTHLEKLLFLWFLWFSMILVNILFSFLILAAIWELRDRSVYYEKWANMGSFYFLIQHLYTKLQTSFQTVSQFTKYLLSFLLHEFQVQNEFWSLQTSNSTLIFNHSCPSVPLSNDSAMSVWLSFPFISSYAAIPAQCEFINLGVENKWVYFELRSFPPHQDGPWCISPFLTRSSKRYFFTNSIFGQRASILRVCHIFLDSLHHAFNWLEKEKF